MSWKERNKAFGFYDFSLLDKLFLHLRLHIVKKHVNFNDKSVLDVGCGYNATNLQYIKKNYSATSLAALDLNLNQEFLGTLGIDCVIGNLEEGVVAGKKYDIILATAILEHIQNDQNFVSSCYEMLNDGGLLVITTPSIWSQPVLEFLAYKIHLIEEVEIRDHKRYYDKKMLMELMTKAGFTKENITHEYFEIKMNNFIIAKKWN
jgi:2-polyprenyl-3-methyl-5-hydroxy-6-metoxy-1,4-benzoquinol methylase